MGALADILVSRGGYNMTDALNAEKGPRAAELAKEFGASTGSSGSSGGGGGGMNMGNFDLSSLMNQANEMRQKNVQPVIDALQKSKSSVTDRYNAIKDELVGGSNKELSREFGRRGIPLSSGLFDQTLNERTQAIVRSNSANQEAALSGIDAQIANLGAGGGGDLVANALDLLRLQQQGGQFDKDLAYRYAALNNSAGGGR